MDAQDALWHIPTEMGGAWWLICAIFALPAATAMLLKMIINEPLSLLTVSRVIIAGSLVAFGMSPLNSGWIPWGVLLASIGGAMAAILIATGWCNMKSQNMPFQHRVRQWMTAHIHARHDSNTGD